MSARAEVVRNTARRSPAVFYAPINIVVEIRSRAKPSNPCQEWYSELKPVADRLPTPDFWSEWTIPRLLQSNQSREVARGRSDGPNEYIKELGC